MTASELVDSLMFLVVDPREIDKKYFICSICNDVLRNTRQCVKSHAFCLSCVTKRIETTPTCPNCEISIEGELPKNEYLDNQINKVAVHCPNQFDLQWNTDRENGCNEKLTFEQLESHKSQCQFKIIKCPHNENCQNIRKNKLLDHEHECPYVLISCSHCNSLLERGKMDDHIQTDCPLFNTSCDKCSQEMLRKDISTHKSSVCSNVEITCCYESCNEIFKRGDTSKHYDWYTHYPVIKKDIDIKDLIINELSIKLAKLESLMKKNWRNEWIITNYDEISNQETVEIISNEYFDFSLSPILSILPNSPPRSYWKFRLTSKSSNLNEFRYSVTLNNSTSKSQKKSLFAGESLDVSIPFQTQYITINPKIQYSIKMIEVITILQQSKQSQQQEQQSQQL